MASGQLFHKTVDALDKVRIGGNEHVLNVRGKLAYFVGDLLLDAVGNVVFRTVSTEVQIRADQAVICSVVTVAVRATQIRLVRTVIHHNGDISVAVSQEHIRGAHFFHLSDRIGDLLTHFHARIAVYACRCPAAHVGSVCAKPVIFTHLIEISRPIYRALLFHASLMHISSLSGRIVIAGGIPAHIAGGNRKGKQKNECERKQFGKRFSHAFVNLPSSKKTIVISMRDMCLFYTGTTAQIIARWGANRKNVSLSYNNGIASLITYEYQTERRVAMLASTSDLHRFYTNKKIVVTGGTGSIGEKIVASLLPYKPKQIVVFSKDDSKQYLMRQRYAGLENVLYQLGDIRDRHSVEYVTRGADYVFHAAALKQVPVCEEHPFEAVKTNIIGTENVIEACITNRVKTAVNISTDKAIHPRNTMGATKLISEKLFLQANHKLNNDHTRFCSVRFGNVVGSRGSVMPIFLQQVKSGKPLTITDEKMTRFVMTIEQAAQLTLKAAYYCRDGETFILRMSAFSIRHLIEAVSRYCALKGLPAPQVKHVGIRPGEKLHEELVTKEEAEIALFDREMYVIPTRPVRSFLHFVKAEMTVRRSDQITPAPIDELLEMLKRHDREEGTEIGS